jgi:hypothetical protein
MHVELNSPAVAPIGQGQAKESLRTAEASGHALGRDHDERVHGDRI